MSACHQQLWQYLTPLGYRPEPRPFVPHISLLRQAQSYALSALPDFSPFAWQSAQCYVMESRPTANGTHYLPLGTDRKSTRLNSSHVAISYAVFCLKKKKIKNKRS